MPRTTRSTAYPTPTRAGPNFSTDQFQIPDAIKQVFVAENDNQPKKSAILQVVEILASLVKVLAMVVGVCLWSVSSIPNILVSAAIVFCSALLWQNTKESFANSYKYAGSFFDPAFSTVDDFRKVAKITANLQNFSDYVNETSDLWQSTYKQHDQHLIRILDLIKDVQKAQSQAQELIDGAKGAPNTKTGPGTDSTKTNLTNPTGNDSTKTNSTNPTGNDDEETREITPGGLLTDPKDIPL